MKKERADDFMTPQAESILLELRNKFLTPEIIANLEAYRQEVAVTFDRLKNEGVIPDDSKTLPMELRKDLMEKYGLRGILEPKKRIK
jgi:hypothetical protein